jgi:hypothetical protein
MHGFVKRPEAFRRLSLADAESAPRRQKADDIAAHIDADDDASGVAGSFWMTWGEGWVVEGYCCGFKSVAERRHRAISMSECNASVAEGKQCHNAKCCETLRAVNLTWIGGPNSTRLPGQSVRCDALATLAVPVLAGAGLI